MIVNLHKFRLVNVPDQLRSMYLWRPGNCMQVFFDLPERSDQLDILGETSYCRSCEVAFAFMTGLALKPRTLGTGPLLLSTSGL